MLPILVSVFGTLPVFKPPESFEPEWLVPADDSFTGDANYVAINTITGKRYEGESVNFHNRHNNHKTNPFNPKLQHKQKKFYNSIRKHGFDKFDFYFRHKFVFDGLEKLNEIERQAFYARFKASFSHPCETYWIRRLNLIKDGYNMKETSEGGAGHIFTDEQKARMSAAAAKKKVTRCEILQDGEMQKVRLTSYASAAAAQRANPGATHISKCCNGKQKSSGGYLWWFVKDTDVYDEDITVERVGDVPGREQAVISVLKLADGATEQWHVGLRISGRTLSTETKKKFSYCCILACLQGIQTQHQGYNFRRVTTEKREDFGADGKRTVEIWNSELYKIKKKRKRE